MGPLEKLKAFGLNLSDIPKTAWMGIIDSASKEFPGHAASYAIAAEQLLNQNGERNVDYNRTKGHFGGLDYMLRYKDRSPEEAEKIARLYQLWQSKFRDPKQDLIDLEANLAGITEGASLRGKVAAADSPQEPNWGELMNRAKNYSDRMRTK